MRLPNPFYEILQGLKTVHLRSYLNLANYLWGFTRWQWNARFAPVQVIANRPAKATIILLSYKRPRNIQPMVRSLLKASCVQRVIVSNNNPNLRLEDWLQLRDRRLHVMNQPVRCFPGFRLELARQDGGEYFLSFDDDVFLFPWQVDQLFSRLLETPSVPHGIYGDLFVEESLRTRYPASQHRHGWLGGLMNIDAPVHVLNRGYAFSRSHLQEVSRLGSLLDIDVGAMPIADDVLLSSAGTALPRCVKLGRILTCPSSARPGVAVSKQKDFRRERARLYCSLRKLKPLPDGEAFPAVENSIGLRRWMRKNLKQRV